jgi:hypothetical protein
VVTRWLWTDAAGAVTDLSAWGAGSYILGEGLTGHLAPSYEFTTQSYAGADGQAVQQITAAPSTPVLPLQYEGTSYADAAAKARALGRALRPKAGMGTLAAVADDGTTRTLPCFYRSGLEAAQIRGHRLRAALQFWAPSPWWRGTPFAYTWALAAASAFFPILPMVLSASTISGAVTVDLSDCDAPTYPRWVVTGPGSQLILANDTTGASLVLNATIGDGQSVAIDTRPGQQFVKQATLNPDGTVAAVGASLFGSLSSDPALWPLLDGSQSVRAVLTNAGAASRIAVTADRLYSGAL